MQVAATRITEGTFCRLFTVYCSLFKPFLGHAEQWGAVTRKKDKKAPGHASKDSFSTTERGGSRGARGGRGGRGGPGRGGAAGGRGFGARGGHRDSTPRAQHAPAPRPCCCCTTIYLRRCCSHTERHKRCYAGRCFYSCLGRLCSRAGGCWLGIGDRDGDAERALNHFGRDTFCFCLGCRHDGERFGCCQPRRTVEVTRSQTCSQDTGNIKVVLGSNRTVRTFSLIF